MVNSKVSKPIQSAKNTGGNTVARVDVDLSSPSFSVPIFHYLTIPKSTAINAPVTYTLNLPIGRINKLWVEFPRGCVGLVGFMVVRGVRQIFPLPEDVWLKSDNYVFGFAFTHVINSEPYEVVLKGYNIDDSYDHTIWVAFEMSGNKSALTPAMMQFLNTLGE